MLRHDTHLESEWCLPRAARIVDPHAKVWRGSHEADLGEQGVTVLGTPVGRPEFVKRELQKVVASHSFQSNVLHQDSPP